jgi:hypothetical protein
MQQPPPRWNQPPLGKPPVPAAKRYEQLGTVCLVLAILELLYCTSRVLNQALGKSMLRGQRALMPSLPNAPPVSGVMDAAEVMMSRVALWEALRTIPFVVATGVLLWIALRLRRGDASALSAARNWMYGAFGAIAASLLIEILVILPAQMDYMRHITDAIPTSSGGASSPIDVKQVTASIALVTMPFTLIGRTAFLAAWPIVLFVWAGRLQRETSPTL